MKELFKSIYFLKARKIYIHPDDVPKYRAMGYTIRRGPRGGLYIDLDERPYSASVKESVQQISGELKQKVNMFAELGFESHMEQVLEEMLRYVNGENEDLDSVFDKIEDLHSEILEAFSEGRIAEEQYRELTEVLDKIEETFDERINDDVLGIKAYRVVIPGDRKYERITERLGVLSKFGNINAVQFVGNVDGNDAYMIDMGDLGKYSVVYDKDGNVKQLKFIVNDKECDPESNAECIVKWLDYIGRDKINKVVDAFREYYGAQVSGRRIVIEIKRPGAEVQKIEVVRPFGGNGRIKWIIYLIIEAKKLGIAWQDINELIHIMNKLGVLKLIKEMFALTINLGS